MTTLWSQTDADHPDGGDSFSRMPNPSLIESISGHTQVADSTSELTGSAWGHKLRFLTVCNRPYLPGAYGLANSAFDNGFQGSVNIFVTDDEAAAAAIPAPHIAYPKLPHNDPEYHPFINRLEALLALPPGNYCYLDSDILIERPSDMIFSAIDDGLLVSTESGSRYEPNDVWLREACLRAGIPIDLPDFPYVNAGLLGFQLPRDEEFIRRLLSLCRKLFRGALQIMEDPFFPFLDQDLLNLLVRERLRNGGRVFVVSPRRVEIGNGSILHPDRKFPYTRQADLRPKDQMKYLIHGASLRRPWIDAARPGLRGRLESAGLFAARRKMQGTLSPYERAWAHYACGKNQTIPVDAWAERHSFSAHTNPLWRYAYGLND